jgi:hypothetical protein
VSRGLCPAAGSLARLARLVSVVSLGALAAGAACGRSQGVPDEQLGDLVIDRKRLEAPIDVARAAKDPAELGRALARPHGAVVAALGPHVVKIAMTTAVLEDGKQLSALDEKTLIELGERGAFHALYTNSADYGSETIFTGGKLYLRPRYQRWHERAPEEPEEPAAIRDRAFGGIAAAWDLLAPGAELVDRGALELAGRAARKIEVRRSQSPAAPPREPLAQRKWREGRSVDELAGEIVLDAQKGVPLAVKLTGAIAFVRDGHRRTMKLGVDGAITGIGTAVAIDAPARAEVVATPERMREVDERDFLLQNIAPPLRHNADGTAAAPQPTDTPKPDEAKPKQPDEAKPKQPDEAKPKQPDEAKPKQPDKPAAAPPKPPAPAPAGQGGP